MLESARRRGLTVATGFNQRYFPAIQFVKQALERGELGELRHVKAYAGHSGLNEFRQPWEHDSQVVGGGTLMDNGIHLIDHVRFLVGEIEEVFGFASSADLEPERLRRQRLRAVAGREWKSSDAALELERVAGVSLLDRSVRRSRHGAGLLRPDDGDGGSARPAGWRCAV